MPTRRWGSSTFTESAPLCGVLQGVSTCSCWSPYERLTGAALPEIKHVAHTNFCDIGWRVDGAGRAVLVSVIDNLLKGASGQAVQNMNVMLGEPETAGLL